MNASKVVAATSAAIALIGAIGFAHSQSNTYDSSGSNTTAQSQSQTSAPASTATDQRIQTQPLTGLTDDTSTPSATPRGRSGERRPRNDRN